jgi:hypothetical protein
VGVEPTTPAAKGRINGFEGHEDHRTPFASAPDYSRSTKRAFFRTSFLTAKGKPVLAVTAALTPPIQSRAWLPNTVDMHQG